jgi:hypothetical protein
MFGSHALLLTAICATLLVGLLQQRVQFSDAGPHPFPHRGLAEEPDVLRPALERLGQLREQHRKYERASATGEANLLAVQNLTHLAGQAGWAEGLLKKRHPGLQNAMSHHNVVGIAGHVQDLGLGVNLFYLFR